MPDIFIKKPVEVEAVQFRAWQTQRFEQLFVWLSDFVPFYVPEGYEHYLRQQHEKDRSRGDTLDQAPPYLVLKINGKDVRVDRFSWIVKYKDKSIEIFNDMDFNASFDKEVVNAPA